MTNFSQNGASVHKPKPLPSQHELKALFHYNPDTGTFLRVLSRSNAHRSGTTAGTVTNTGYRKVWVNNTYYYASRLIWMWMTGEDPDVYVVDHINGNRNDNRWSNLRKANNVQNARNSRDWSSKRTGLPRGVAICGNKYKATIMKSHKNIHLGVFGTPEEAHAAYAAAKALLHGEFAGSYRSADTDETVTNYPAQPAINPKA